MPTILRFGAYRVMIFTEDHGPAHVHVFGPDTAYVFLLACPKGPVRLRERLRGTTREMTRVARILESNLDMLCAAWRNCMANEFVAAGRRMDKMRSTLPYAVAVRYDSRLHRVFVTLSNHLEIAINPEQVQVLQGKKAGELRAIEILPGGYALYFPALDEGLYLPGVYGGVFGTKKWMREQTSTKKRRAA